MVNTVLPASKLFPATLWGPAVHVMLEVSPKVDDFFQTEGVCVCHKVSYT